MLTSPVMVLLPAPNHGAPRWAWLGLGTYLLLAACGARSPRGEEPTGSSPSTQAGAPAGTGSAEGGHAAAAADAVGHRFDTSVATGQSYEAAMRILCTAGQRVPASDNPDLHAFELSRYLDERLLNLEARTFLAALANVDPSTKSEWTEAAAGRAGLCDCPIASGSFGVQGAVPTANPRTCGGRERRHPAERAPAQAEGFAEAMRILCDETLQDPIGSGPGADAAKLRHAAYVDARAANPAFRQLVNSWRGGDRAATLHRRSSLAEALRRAGLESCPFLRRELAPGSD